MSLKLLIYNTDCLRLARSMLVKSDMLARDVEYLITGSTAYLDRDRTTWKYYLNISGEYHPTNEVMTITSLDTLTSIEFNKANLADHPITKAKYSGSSDLLDELIEKYPDNNMLIMGIMYDVNITEVIEASELQILGYNSSLVGVQEIDLIPRLQERLYSEYSAYINKDYIDIEPLYSSVVMAFVAKQVLIAIKTIRLSNYKTSRACDFYIWTYINSKIALEDLKYDLSNGVIFYLYKNIDRLVREAGSNKVLYELVNKLLNDYLLDTYRLGVGRSNTELDRLTPKIDVVYEEYDILGVKSNRNLDIDDYIKLGDERSNKLIPNYLDQLEDKTHRSKDLNLTRELKVVETIETPTDTELLLSNLDLFIYTVTQGHYSSVHSIDNHVSGQVYTLTTQEAIIVYHYVVMRRLGVGITEVPTYDPLYYPLDVMDSSLEIGQRYNIDPVYVDKIKSILPTHPGNFKSLEELNTYIYAFRSCRRTFIRTVRNLYTRHNQNTLSRIYKEFIGRGSIQLVPDNTDFNTWLASKDIVLDDFSLIDFSIMERNILGIVFGINLDTNVASSYTVSILNLLNRFNNYRINMVAVSNNLNLVDYQVSPLYHKAILDPTITKATYDTKLGTRKDSLSNNLFVDVSESNKYLNKHTVGLVTETLVNYRPLIPSGKSWVSTPSTIEYVSDINLRKN